MTLKTSTIFAAGAVLSLAYASSTLAYTHHPATPEEMRQTDALNAQSLANARGATGGQETAAMTPASTSASASTTAAVAPLKSLAAMPPALSTAGVQSSAGAMVGNVQKVLTGSDGKPSMVNVALSSNQKIVAISADELNYDAARNVLVAALTTEQIMSLPAAGS